MPLESMENQEEARREERNRVPYLVRKYEGGGLLIRKRFSPFFFLIHRLLSSSSFRRPI